MRMARPSWRTPALLTSTRIGPKRSCTSSNAAPMPRVPPVTSAQRSWPLWRALSGTGLATLLPADDAGTPHEPGAEGGQGDGGARRQQTLLLGPRERGRDRGGRRVGGAIDVDRDLLARQPQLGRGRLDDADVGLMGDEQVDVVDRAARALERLAAGADHAAHRVAVDLAAFHAQDARVALRVEEVGLLAVGAQHEAADAQFEVLAARDDHGAGAVAEDHGR